MDFVADVVPDSRPIGFGDPSGVNAVTVGYVQDDIVIDVEVAGSIIAEYATVVFDSANIVYVIPADYGDIVANADVDGAGIHHGAG